MDIYKALKTYFGFDEFKDGQKSLVDGVLEGKDTLGIMPTGGGKSLCYQLPAVLLEGITLVISPLIALMKDQVDGLNEIGIPGTFINSSIGDSEIEKRIRDIKEWKYKIIYIAPERLNSYSFLNLSQELKISMIAVDEAHCISQWGHDFRPAYTEIPKFIHSLESRPIVGAYTATATKLVIDEIKNLLGLISPIESIISFDRPNLFYQVVKVSNKFSYLLDSLKSNFINESGIIYCATRKTVESLAQKLNDHGFRVLPYHGGMDNNIRQAYQEDFIQDRVKIIVATNAFGLGIDKPDIRFVIHYNMPQNMEAYYQEAGRAGRDGEPSYCTLLYSPADIVKQKFLIQNSTFSEERENILYQNLQYLVDYCHTSYCLRGRILKYFGENPKEEKCNNCGNCLDQSEYVDITIEAQKILSCIYRVRERYGLSIIIQILRGSKSKRIKDFGLDQLSTYGIMKEYSESALREIVMSLISKGYIYMTPDKYPVLKLSASSKDILLGKEKVYHKKHLLHIKDSSKETSRNKDDILRNYDESLFSKLKELRYSIAQRKIMAPFMIFHDSSLREMASFFPQNKSEMLEIKGVGLKKFESYGEDFLNLILEYMTENKVIPIRKEVTTQPYENSSTSRYEETYDVYKKGLNIHDIAKERGYRITTIIRHLLNLEKSGRLIDWDRFIDSPQMESLILDAVKEVGLERLKPVKELLPGEISYEDIKIVIAKNGLE